MFRSVDINLIVELMFKVVRVMYGIHQKFSRVVLWGIWSLNGNPYQNSINYFD
jgi:hypothetical protein